MTTRSIQAQLLGLLGWVAATSVFGAVGGLASANDTGFYGSLVQPAWAPPAWLFGPVWSTLYLAMSVSAWLIWRRHGFSSAKPALTLFFVQLSFNALWTWLFFFWHAGGAALAELIVLWILIALTIGMFWKLHRVAAALMIPYLLWVSFAGVLNYSLWRLNPTVL